MSEIHAGHDHAPSRDGESSSAVATRAPRDRRPAEERRFTLSNDLTELARVSAIAGELLERCGAVERVVYVTQLALEELLSNVIRHGYADGASHEISVWLRAGAYDVELEITDDAREFDPTSAPEPALDVPLSERRSGGLGVHLVRAFVAAMRYERSCGRNVLWLRI